MWYVECAIDCRISIAQPENERNMTTSLRDVAEKAHTSPGTVSRVLNGGKSAFRISEATRKRIFAAVDTLGYRPNIVARSLRTKRTYSLGVVVHGEQNVAEHLKAAEYHANQRGYELLLAVSRWDAKREEDVLRRLLSRGVDGLLLISPVVKGDPDKILENLVARNFPLVGVGPMILKGADFVDWDRVGVYHELTKHLIERGCRRLAFGFTSEITPGIQGRIDGIRKAAGEAQGVTLNVMTSEADMYDDKSRLTEFLRRKLDEIQPDAVLCATDDMAVAISSVAKSMGKVLPRDLAVTGCSNHFSSQWLDVPLTTVVMPAGETVRVAINRLVHRIENPGEEFDPMAEYVPAELVFRVSSSFGGTTHS